MATWADVVAALPKGLELLGSGLQIAGIAVPGAGAAGGIITALAHKLGTDATPDAVLTAVQTDPAAAQKMMEVQANCQVQLQQIAASITLAQMQAVTTQQAAQLADVKDARGRDTILMQLGKINWRADIMLLMAYASVITIIYMLINGKVDGASAIGGAMIGLIGLFSRDISSAFNFEFGTSRGSEEKNKTIADQSTMLGNSTPNLVPVPQSEVKP